MPATPGTQIGPDGRRVAIADLPDLTAREVAEAQRLALLGLPELSARKRSDESRAAVAAPGTSTGRYDALVADDDLYAEVEADTRYTVEMVLAIGVATGDADIYLSLLVPPGAVGRMHVDGDNTGTDLVDSDDAGRTAYNVGWSGGNTILGLGYLQTDEAGTVALAWQPFGSSGAQELLAGSILRLTAA